MSRKFKLALAALLGFSAACSSVKNTSARDAGPQETREVEAQADTMRHRIVVMYGVRPPQQRPVGQPMPDPVAERPVDSLDAPSAPNGK